jgi:hypothetical protein
MLMTRVLNLVLALYTAASLASLARQVTFTPVVTAAFIVAALAGLVVPLWLNLRHPGGRHLIWYFPAMIGATALSLFSG